MLLKVGLTAGERHDNLLAGELVAVLPKGAMVLADRGCEVRWIRQTVSDQGCWVDIPARKASQGRRELVVFSLHLYRTRNAIERLKQFRAVATRHDKLAANLPAAIKLACVRLWLRRNEPTS